MPERDEFFADEAVQEEHADVATPEALDDPLPTESAEEPPVEDKGSPLPEPLPKGVVIR